MMVSELLAGSSNIPVLLYRENFSRHGDSS
jgi:hypothetical protein